MKLRSVRLAEVRVDRRGKVDRPRARAESRRWLRVAAVLGVLVGLAGLAWLAPPNQERADAQPGQPNVVFIMTDDQDAASLQFMPKTRHLLGDFGTTYTHDITNFPLCCPARATMVTGQTAHNHGVLWNADAEFGGYKRLDHAESLPSWFQRKGYTTSFMGKYLNGYGCNLEGLLPFVPDNLEVPEGWNDWGGLVCQSEYKMYGFTMNDNGTLVTPPSIDANYQTDYLARRAVDRIGQFASDPFFLYVAPLAPHAETGGAPPRSAPRHNGQMANLPLPTPPNFNESDVSDKPPHISANPLLNAAELNTITTSYRQRMESLLAVDDLVESVVNKLQQTGQLDNTIIVYTSDNGWFSGEHRITDGKIEAYEEAVHLPLIIRGPGFAAGTTVTTPVSNIDVVPTIAALTGIDATRVMDGTSLLNPVANRAIPIESGPKFPELDYKGLRTPYWKYIERAEGSKELYDLANDPYELNNLINVGAYDTVEDKLRAALDVLRTCKGETCVMRMGGPQNADFAPQIATAPTPTSAVAGATATFTATVTGSGLSYQWQRNGADLPGANAATYTTPPLGAGDDGATYRLVVSNVVGSTTSAEAVLRVVDSAAGAPWWDNARSLRVPLALTALPNRRIDATFEVPLDLGALGGAPMNPASLRVVELGGDGTATAEVPFQWEPGPGTTGLLVVQAPGTTAAGATRRFHAYMDPGSGFTPVSVTDQVVVTNNVTSNDLTNAMRIATPGGTWIYDVDGGAFAGLFDAAGADWIGWNTAPKSGGEFRGIPNPVNPEGQLHPGRTDANTSVLFDGPVRMSLRSVTDDGLWQSRWDVYARHAVLTMEKGAHAYWVVYEGVPGGAVDEADLTSQSDGDVSPLSEYWAGDIGRKEWVATTDPNAGRTVLLGNLEDDEAIDSSWVYDNEGLMAVVGLGRRFDVPAATDIPHQYVVSLLGTAAQPEVDDLGFGLIEGALAVSGVPEGGGSPSGPSILQHPANAAAALGAPVTFTVQAQGTAPLSYQWQRNEADIPGATASSYTVPAVSAGDSGARYRVVVSNGQGTVTSNAGVLTVSSAVPKLRVVDTSVVEGNSGAKTVNVTVELNAAKAIPVTAIVSTVNGTAKATDFTARKSVALNFAPGTVRQTLAVTIKGDTAVEPSETFKVSIVAAVGAPIGRKTGVVTITNDD